MAGAFIPAPTPTPSGSSSGGAGRTVILNNVLPESHFALFPLDRVQVKSSAFLNAAGLTIAEARVNQQISVSAEFTNYQSTEQNYAFIVQVTSPEGFVTDIRWQENTLGSGQTTQASTSVTPENEGIHTVKIFVWDGIIGTPKALSEVTVKNLQVTE